MISSRPSCVWLSYAQGILEAENVHLQPQSGCLGPCQPFPGLSSLWPSIKLMALVNNSVCTWHGGTQQAVAITLLLFYNRHERNAWGMDNIWRECSEGRLIPESGSQRSQWEPGRREGLSGPVRATGLRNTVWAVWLQWEVLVHRLEQRSQWRKGRRRGWGRNEGQSQTEERTTNVRQSYWESVPASIRGYQESLHLGDRHVPWNLGRPVWNLHKRD